MYICICEGGESSGAALSCPGRLLWELDVRCSVIMVSSQMDQQTGGGADIKNHGSLNRSFLPGTS